jgi:phenylacetate-CoA ligase
MPWNDKFECMPVEKLKKFQLEQLKETVAWVSERVPFYQKKFKVMGIKADDLKSLEDVARLPFTVKNDLRDNYPFGLCAVPLKDVVRVHASSGTTGKPITGPYTAEELVFEKRMWFKMHTVTVFLPVALDFIRAHLPSAARWFRPAPE